MPSEFPNPCPASSDVPALIPAPGDTVRVLIEIAREQAQWTLASFVGMDEEGEEGKRYRVRIGGAELLVKKDEIAFFPAKNPDASHPIDIDGDDTESLYREGMTDAERELQGQARDYDRLLFGLTRVLRAKGIESTPMELHDLFHHPVALYTVRMPLAEIVSGLNLSLKPTEAQVSWEEKEVTSGRISLYCGFRSVEDDLLSEEELHMRRKQVEDALDPGRQSTLQSHLSSIHRTVRRIRRSVEVVEALAGTETEQTRERTSYARRLEEAATWLERRVRRQLKRIDQRLLDLPVKRAKALRPIAELKLNRDAFRGNRAERDAPFITDGSLLIPKEAIRRQDRAERLTLEPPKLAHKAEPISDKVCRYTFENACTAATQDAELLGFIEYRRHDSYRSSRVISTLVAVAVTAEREAAFLDAELVRFIESVVGGFEGVKVLIRAAGPAAQNPERRAAYEPAVFYRKGSPVAVLMPLRYNLEELPVDVATARKVAGVSDPSGKVRSGQDVIEEIEARSRREALIEGWLEFGNEVPWMEMASTPFDHERFVFCADVDELVTRLLAEETHALGTAFALGDVCFICLNELGTDEEWLMIKGTTSIGNIPLRVRDDDGCLDREATAGRVRETVGSGQSAPE